MGGVGAHRAPGTRTGPHRHNRMDEAFYVVRRTLTVYAEGQPRTTAGRRVRLIPCETP